MTRNGVTVSGQPGNFGAITGVSTAAFDIDGIGNEKVPFNIKNNTTGNITLTVTPAGGGAAASMIFYPCWNVEIVASIAINAAITNTDLSWGY